ncbi:unnamed protein product [Rotaria sordida]|uniref:Ataxin-10 domain-containing protein n=1 Tax=Rotaria sordida TaxID=392033 RepID=A0A814GIS2_9BILA|nr:unnamed protein product [Rotaria sordida]
MDSSDEFLSFLNDPNYLANLLKEKSNLIIDDSIYFHIANYFLGQKISVEGLSVQRNLYGRQRSSLLNQCEIDLLILNIKECLNSNSKELTKIFLQYLHNINRLLPNNFRDIAYLCALILLPYNNKNVIACILCAYLEMNTLNNLRYDLIINDLYKNEDEQEDNPWIDKLTKLIIENDNQWLRKFYLEKIYTKEFLHAIDIHDKENIFNIEPIKQNSEDLSSTIIEKIDLNQVSTLDDLHSKLSFYVINYYPNNSINELSLFNLLSSSNNYPNDLHILFSCSLISIINRNNYSILSLRLFRRLILLINNYYINQQDLLDDNRYRLIIVFLVSKLICEVHRRRSISEHEWYRLYIDIPKEYPLPTFDLFADLICLLATLCYNHIDCQNQVRQTSGTIESILSMTQIDLNQPKAQACVSWLIKCLTENNEDNRNYIKQIK